MNAMLTEAQVQALPLGEQIKARYERIADLENWLDGETSLGNILSSRYGRLFVAANIENLVYLEQLAANRAEEASDAEKLQPVKEREFAHMLETLRREVFGPEPREYMGENGQEHFGWPCDIWTEQQVRMSYEEHCYNKDLHRRELGLD